MILKTGLTVLVLVFLLYSGNPVAVAGDEDRILVIAQNMETAFKKLEDYTCEVEQLFYQDGVAGIAFGIDFFRNGGLDIH